MADVAWKPNDNEMENDTYKNYDWTKWKKWNYLKMKFLLLFNTYV